MDDAFLRRAADAAIRGEQVMADAQRHLTAIIAAIDRGDYTFQEANGPRGSRALQATNKAGSRLLVVQYNHETNGIGHTGTVMLNDNGRPMVINLPPEVADYVYHKATGSRN